MAAPEVFPLAQVPLTAHAFSADRQREFGYPVVVELRLMILYCRDCCLVEFQRCADLYSHWARLETDRNALRSKQLIILRSQPLTPPRSTTNSSPPSTGPPTPTASSPLPKTATPTSGTKPLIPPPINPSGNPPSSSSASTAPQPTCAGLPTKINSLLQVGRGPLRFARLTRRMIGGFPSC